MKEKQLLLFDENSEPILPELILSNLNLEEKEELKKMQEVFKEFDNMNSDQQSNYELWQRNFISSWGDLSKFMIRLSFLENNKTCTAENIKANILEKNNINKLRTIQILWKYFWEKNKYSIHRTNGIKTIQDAFNQFKNKKSIQKNKKIFNIKELFEKLKIDSFTFEEYQKLIKDYKIISALKTALLVYKTRKKAKSYLPKSRFPY